MNVVRKDRGLMVVQGRGGGGGKDGGRTPVEDRDTLRSTQMARTVDLIGEGECEGLANGLQDWYLDGVPIQNSDGTFNFEGVYAAWTVGTPGQPAIPGIPGVETERSVQVEVKQATPLIRTITDTDIDTVRVTIAVPQLTFQDMETGDLKGAEFEFVIEVQSDGGGYVERYRQTIRDKCTSVYTRSINVPLSGGAPYDVRVRRITPDSTQSNLINSFTWLSYTEVVSLKLRYPHSCVAMLQVNAQQFSRVPVRGWRWRGLRIQVPTNYDPIARTYSGAWDGTFKMAWSNNPAWCMYAMVTHPRWGLGQFVAAELQNKWALYQIGQYCDELVSDGRGGQEPRFSCNVVFSTRAEAYQVLQDMAALFRGMVFWAASTVEYAQDAPQDAELLYTPSNTVDGFTYQDTSERTLHSVFIAYWNDMTQMGKKVPEVYAPSDLIARYGLREIAVQTIGCTSRAQAARVCRWMRYTEQQEGTVIAFRVGADGDVVMPGKVFKVADPSEAGERLGGRIVSATSSEVRIDQAVELRAGEAYTLTVLKPDPSDDMGLKTEERTVITPAGTVDLLQVTPAFSFTPHAQTVWVLQSDMVKASTWRCLTVKPVKGSNGASEFEVTGIAHNPSKYDYIENAIALDDSPISRIGATVRPPTEVDLLETVYTDGVTNKSQLTVSWVPSAKGLRHRVDWRQDTGWWQSLPETTGQSVDLKPLDPGVYEVTVRAINALGNISAAVQRSITIAGGRSGVRGMRMRASSLVFRVSVAGLPTPSSITVEADKGGLSNPITWSVATGSATLTNDSAEEARTLAYADMATSTVTIEATVTENGSAFTDRVTIIKVFDGAPGLDGEPGEPGEPGQPGVDAISAQMTLDSITLPADGSGAVTDYTGAFSSMVVFSGADIDTANWTFTRSSTSGLTTSISGSTVTVLAMSGGLEAAVIEVTATRSGFPSLTRKVYVAKAKRGATGDPGTPGQRGSVTLSAEFSGSAWSDSAANAAIVARGYDGPVNLDIVSLVNADAGWSEARFHVDGSWLTLQAFITGNLMVDGTVGARHLVVNGGVGASLWGDPNCVDQGAWRHGEHGAMVSFAITTTGDTGANVLRGGVGGASADGWPMVPVSESKSYRISARARKLDGANGGFYLRYVYGAEPRGARVQQLGDVEAVQLTTDWVEYAWTFTLPAGSAKYIAPRVILNQDGSAGFHEVQDVRIQELLDSSLIVQGGILADRIQTDSLGALSANLGDVEITENGNLRGGQTNFNTGNGFWIGKQAGNYKFSLRNNNGRFLTFDEVGLLINGAFTADAVNAVNTINLAGNAVTIPLQGQWYGSIAGDSSTQLAYTPWADFYGAPVFIVAQVVGRQPSGGVARARVRIFRDGGAIADCPGQSITFPIEGFGDAVAVSTYLHIDYPPSGSHYYSCGTTGGDGVIISAKIGVIGAKR